MKRHASGVSISPRINSNITEYCDNVSPAGGGLDRGEFVRRFVLMEIADDYESKEHMASLIARDASECGFTISGAEIEQSLVELLEAGLARAYCLRSKSVLETGGDSLTHYRATPEGTELLTADRDWWPFDDEGELRLNWKPPED
jgi:hypothetical protein